MRKNDLNVHVFHNRNWCRTKCDRWFFLTVRGPFHRKYLKNMGMQVYFLKKRKLCMQNLTKDRKQPPVAILQQVIFCNMFILCLWLRTLNFMNFPSQIFFNDINHGYRAALLQKNYLWLIPFYVAEATYCYHEKVWCALQKLWNVSYLLKTY